MGEISPSMETQSTLKLSECDIEKIAQSLATEHKGAF
jgi:hypothetical protein